VQGVIGLMIFVAGPGLVQRKSKYSRKMRRLATPVRRKSFWKSLTMLAGPQRKTESVAGFASVTARTCCRRRAP
jgi:hypothetical protein